MWPSKLVWTGRFQVLNSFQVSAPSLPSVTFNSFAMKSMLPPVLATLVALTATVLSLPAQAIFSRFDFNGTPLTTATIGPNGTSTDPDAVIDGTAAYITANCGGTKGIDLLIPNPGGLFDRNSMGMAFRFRKEEARSDFFVRGGTWFFQADGVLFVAYRTTDGAGGTIDYGPINTGYILPTDSTFHEYIFVYEHLAGLATVTVDGVPVYTFDGPDNRPYDWTAAPDALVGTVMDGNCPGTGVLDYAYFFDPETPLSAASIQLLASAEEGDVQLDWEAPFAPGQGHVTVERSRDGHTFAAIATLDLAVNPLTRYRDVQPGGGAWYYRIAHQDASGSLSHSETRHVALAAATALQVWPNPTAGDLDLRVPERLVGQPLTLLNLQGQAVLTRTATEGRMAWSLVGLAPGYYLLQGQAGGQVYRQRVLLR